MCLGRKEAALNEKKSMATAQHGVGSTVSHFWVGTYIGSRNMVMAETRMDSTKYQQIMEANVIPSVKQLKLKKDGFYNSIMILNTA